jgi:BON domain
MRARGASLMLLAALLPALSCLAQDKLLMNPFNDPFVPVTHGDASCPLPRGPAYTEREFRQEEHSRVERGTTCWLSGQCSEPNAYRYDARNADATVRLLQAEPALAAASIWIVAERRFIYLQGCVQTAEQAARAEALARQVPDVQIVIPMLSLPGEAPRYPRAIKTP